MHPETKIIIDAFTKKFDQVDKRFDQLEGKLTKKIEDEVEGLAIMTSNNFDRADKKFTAKFTAVDNKFDMLEQRLSKK
jgi:hypothetical protein